MENLSRSEPPYFSRHSCYEEAAPPAVERAVTPVGDKIDSIRLQPPFTMDNFAVCLVVLSYMLLGYGFNLVIA